MAYVFLFWTEACALGWPEQLGSIGITLALLGFAVVVVGFMSRVVAGF